MIVAELTQHATPGMEAGHNGRTTTMSVTPEKNNLHVIDDRDRIITRLKRVAQKLNEDDLLRLLQAAARLRDAAA